MPTVTELKKQAREAEQQGNLVDAIDIYQHILRHLESWPDALAEELNLYTRVGDLRVELHQPARAFAAYRQAAEHYARLGSAENVKILCVRMINVVPSSADAYAVYAKRLLAHGHLGGALDVLREYAAKAELKDVARTVEGLTGRSSGETRALLSELLESLERDYQGHTKAARRISAELAVVPERASRAAEPETTSPARQKVADKPAATLEKPAPTTTRPEGVQPQPTVPPAAQTPSTPSAERAAPPAPPRGTPQPTSPAPRKEDRPAATKRTGAFNWRPVGVGGAIAAGVTVLIVAAIQMGDGDASPAPEAMAALIDTSPGAVDEGTAVGDTLEAAAPAPAQPAPQPPVQRPEPEPEPEPEPVVPPAVPDSAPVSTDDTTSTAAAGDSATVDDSTLVIAQPLVIGDLPVQSVAPSEFRGQSGFRVVHMLDSATQFVVESYPVDSTSARRYPVGSIIVNNIPPDTTVSIVRFDERYLVFASGAVPEDSARVLIELLRIREPAN